MQTDLLDNYLSNVPVVIGDLILTEVLQGFRSNKDHEIAKNFLGDLPFRQIGGYNVAIKVPKITDSFEKLVLLYEKQQLLEKMTMTLMTAVICNSITS